MNNLCTDIGYLSLNKWGEQLCGDRVEVVEQGENSTVIVLADGMGSGVKANILSSLTSKIISTMMAANMRLEDCVSTIASTLPVCAVRGVAYSTFTIIHIIENEEAEIIQYDNPLLILIRDGKFVEIPKVGTEIEGKMIYKSKIKLQENDFLFTMSDGTIHAGVGQSLNFGWERKDIIKFLEMMYDQSYTAKTYASLLLEECNHLYGGHPGDDTTVCVVKVRDRQQVNLMIGPPSDRRDVNKYMSLFFSKEGKHIVCGGTTSTLASDFLKKPMIANLDYLDPEIPPTAKIEGVDLVTERDGASLISRMLFEEATDINFFVGRAINPAHQNPNLPINFNIKMRLVEELSECLKQMGKRIKVSYF